MRPFLGCARGLRPPPREGSFALENVARAAKSSLLGLFLALCLAILPLSGRVFHTWGFHRTITPIYFHSRGPLLPFFDIAFSILGALQGTITPIPAHSRAPSPPLFRHVSVRRSTSTMNTSYNAATATSRVRQIWMQRSRERMRWQMQLSYRRIRLGCMAMQSCTDLLRNFLPPLRAVFAGQHEVTSAKQVFCRCSSNNIAT